MRAALAQHDEMLHAAVNGHGGRVFSTMGDGIAAVFATAGQAVSAAQDAQSRLQGHSWLTAEPIRVRMGLHTGEAEERGGDYFGTAVNRTARLMAIGHGGQILCSASTAELLDGSTTLKDLGEHRLRDLDRSVRVFQIDDGAHLPLRSMTTLPGNLPLQVSSFIGREREMDLVARAVEASRLVTLTGVGGVGKTRLALHAAADLLPRFADGTWLVELAPVRHNDGVVGAFTAAFCLTPRAGLTLEESLVEFLRTKEILLIVDNCEHLLDEVGRLVSILERSCVGLVLLATSREGLAVEGERIVPVRPLPAPDIDADPAEGARTEAMALFVERAVGVDPDFELTEHNGAAIAQVCRRLDGVPLAIELAASQVGAMTAADLAAGLDRRFETLAGGRRGGLDRHRTLRAAMDWSYELCTPLERLVLARLAVFSGGCDRPAVEAVCAGPSAEASAIAPALRALVAKSLVVAERNRAEARYRMLETIREYAEERLADLGETIACRARHAEHYIGVVSRSTAVLWTNRHDEAVGVLTAEHDNVVAVIDHAVDTDDADIGLRLMASIAGIGGFMSGYDAYRLKGEPIVALSGAQSHPCYALAESHFANVQASSGQLDSAARHMTRATEERGPHSVGPDLLDWNTEYTQAIVALVSDDHGQAAAHLERSARISLDAGRSGHAAVDLAGAAFEAGLGSDAATAERLATDGLVLARQVNLPIPIAMNLNSLAGALAERHPKRARQLLEESMAVNFPGDRSAADLTQLVLLWARLNDWHQTLSLADQAIRSVHWVGSWFNLVAICNAVARALAQNDAEAAAVVQGMARHFTSEAQRTLHPRQRLDSADRIPRTLPDGGGVAGPVLALRRDTTRLLVAELGEDRLRALKTVGAAMSNDDAVTYALEAVAKARSALSP